MQNKIEYDYIASSKVIRHALGPQAADILATLIYKYQYWESQGKLNPHKGLNCFHISINDLREETCFGKSVIDKNIKRLEKEGLIQSFRQGLTKPNLYYLNKDKVVKFIKNNERKYNTWRQGIRSKNSTKSPNNTLMAHSGTSSRIEMEVQDNSLLNTTNNKNTNNKSTNNKNTNCVNAEEYYEVLYDKLDELEGLLESYKFDCLEDDDECVQEIYIQSLFITLKNLIPDFSNYKMSNKDRKFLSETLDYPIKSYVIASKIIDNATSILNGDKEERFGNLFIGLSQLNENISTKYDL